MNAKSHQQWRPPLLLTRRFITDYVRNPVNLIVLVLVPLVFVVVAARSLADTMELLGGSIGPALQTVTAGWAAGFLSGLAMYFQIRSARAADRRAGDVGHLRGRPVKVVDGSTMPHSSAIQRRTLWFV